MSFRRTCLRLREAKPIFDADGLPTKPTWSLRALLESQPRFELSQSQLQHLYKLSALRPPPPNSAEEAKIKSELQEMIRLVEAVRTCPLLQDQTQNQSARVLADGSEEADLPDGRVWPAGQGMEIVLDWGTSDASVPQAERKASKDDKKPASELLKLAKRTRDGFYVAPSPTSGSQEMG